MITCLASCKSLLAKVLPAVWAQTSGPEQVYLQIHQPEPPVHSLLANYVIRIFARKLYGSTIYQNFLAVIQKKWATSYDSPHYLPTHKLLTHIVKHFANVDNFFK